MLHSKSGSGDRVSVRPRPPAPIPALAPVSPGGALRADRLFLAGAAGTIGRALIPLLQADG